MALRTPEMREFWLCPVCGKRVFRHTKGKDNFLCKPCTKDVYGYETRKDKRRREWVMDQIMIATRELDAAIARGEA